MKIKRKTVIRYIPGPPGPMGCDGVRGMPGRDADFTFSDWCVFVFIAALSGLIGGALAVSLALP